MSVDFAIGIGGAAGQGIATPGNILARIFARRGLHLQTYNAHQSIIRGGHTFLTLRVHEHRALSIGDQLDLMIALNQDTLDRHLRLMSPGSYVLFNKDKLNPGPVREGVQLCPLPVRELSQLVGSKGEIAQNTLALAATLCLLGVEFDVLEEILSLQFAKKGPEVIRQNVDLARAGYHHAREAFLPFDWSLPDHSDRQLAALTGNQAMALGAVAAGVKFYCAYPMSPATGILMWLASHARQAGMLVRQAEDEIAVINAVIGAAHTGVRAMTATSGGGFALMSEAIGMAGIMELPLVCVNVMRGGPSTGLPTKTEQADLWQVLGASQGDFPKIIVAVTDVQDSFETIPQLFNLVDKYQCPGMVISDLYLSEGTATVPAAALHNEFVQNRGELIRPPDIEPGFSGEYLRYLTTDSGISPRAVPGTPGHAHVVASDEHDEAGVLISDEFTNPHKRRQIADKRQRKVDGLLSELPLPGLEGPVDAELTLVGWGSTHGVIREAIQQLGEQGISANHLQIKWLWPFPADHVEALLKGQKHLFIV
ncbi:MAG: 2-oxoacid:acceptor oxidoreductase subunit alpha, partial [Candidatus Sericytochromatia bacterium]